MARWGWLVMVDNVAEVTKESWDKIFEKNIIEFLNLNCYIKEKREFEKKQIESFQKGTTKHY